MNNCKEEKKYQEIIFDIWKEILPDVQFGIDDNFFDLGGNSLQAINVIGKLSEKFQVDIPKFFANPTIRNIATSLTEDTDTMKKEFLQTFSFEELQKTDVQEQAEYRKNIFKLMT